MTGPAKPILASESDYLFVRRHMRLSPSMLRGLGVTSLNEIHSATSTLSFLSDDGDRMVDAYALIVKAPVLITDRRTF